MKYRKKPIIVDAFKWTGGRDQTEDPEWAVIAIRSGIIEFENEKTSEIKIIVQSWSGVIIGGPGDYLIRNPNGEIILVDPDKFEATYELVGGQ